MSRVSVLIACTGNVCRSPFAEFALQAALHASAPGVYSVSSAGTQALVGEDMTEETASLLRANGIPMSAFSARRLDQRVIDDADIVLTATRAHRSAVVDLSPPMLRRTFTIREFAGMLGSVDVEPQGAHELWNAVLPELLQLRPWRRPELPEDDDVTDPYRRGEASYVRMAAEILPAVDAIARFVGKHTS
ncbi:low molecular weight phosphatase family protein [Plantibacter sp. YIM 135347]|uniref:arsenate reductase/protein-tyrosine-phosphatase family protein n=1 Tax=Plantibacter sp. YIM 135347 TaxID=3423919 RepID=UPI003D33C937